MIPDARGVQSTTLTFVVIAFLAVLFKFVIGGMQILGMAEPMPVISAAEFGIAITGILAIWRHREVTNGKQDSSSN